MATASFSSIPPPPVGPVMMMFEWVEIKLHSASESVAALSSPRWVRKSISSELAERIRKTSQTLEGLKQLGQLQKPKRMTAAELMCRRDEIASAFASANVLDRRAIMAEYDVKLYVDAKEKVIRGTMGDPLSPRDNDGGSDDLDPDPPSCNKVVGQESRARTALLTGGERPH